MIKDFFLPTESNGYYPLGVRPKFLYTCLVFTLVFNLFATKYISFIPHTALAQSMYSPQSIISLTNEDRTQAGLSTVSENQQLDLAAKNKAADMFKYQYWAHINPTTGATPWNFIVAASYDYHYAGENLAQGYLTADDVNTAWLNSPEHKANILNDHYKDIGVAIESGTLQGSDIILVVQMFGSTQAEDAVAPLATPTQPKATSTPLMTNTPQIPKQSASPSPTQLVTQTTGISATSTPSILASPTVLSAGNTPPLGVAITPTPIPPSMQHALSDIGIKISGMSFVNKINLSIAVILLILFALDSIYYYNVRNIHSRSKPNSIAHLPMLALLLIVCLIGTTGLIT